MAESVVSSVVSHVVSQLANLLIDEAVSSAGVRGQIDWVKTKLQFLQGFLKDADSRRKRGDARMESWMSGIRGVAYDMEDVIDTINFIRERQHQRRGFIGTISRYSHKPCELITLHKISSKIEQIKQKIRHIDEIRATCGMANLGESGVQKSSDWDDNLQALRQLPEHYFDDMDVIGLEGDKEKLVELLVDPENKTCSVISIVGMGGLGKTTLARKVYNMDEVKQHFDTSVWLTISQKYDVKAILKDMAKNNISNIAKEELEEMTEEGLKQRLYNFFQDRKYFVVMDDVWGVVVWERIGQVFPDRKNGSRVLLTARNIEVAKSIDPSIDPYELHFLNDAESWQLFCRKAFPYQDIPEELQGVGRSLAKKCGGLPLALVVLGGFMSSKERSLPTWSEVDKSLQWEFIDRNKRCLDILALSYDDLPHQLKPCFLYIAAFPEDSIISASKLVRLWTAEGFIPQRRKQTLEKTARDLLDELVQRCMIQVVERSIAHGWVKSIRIHDMLRDFGQSEARKDGFLHVCSSDDMAISDGISSHRAAFHNRIQDELAVSSPHLRTFLGFDLVLEDRTTAGRFLIGLNLLRVLDLEGARDLKKLPKQIGNMIHLRYLGLRNTGLKRLPSSIRHLLNLRTLDARRTDILCLPKSFWKIRMLRHLYINTHMFLSASINGDHKNMQTLEIRDFRIDMDFMYIARSLGVRFIKNWVTAPGFTKEAIKTACQRMFAESFGRALEKMDSLLSLTLFLNERMIPGDILFARAPNLRQLRSLTLWGRLLLKQQQQLPDSSKFPPNLTKLNLGDTELEQDPMPVLEKLPNLRLLSLSSYAYVGKSMSCSSIGGFRQLQHLILTSLHSLEEWRVEAGAMPNLTHLTIIYCNGLKMLPVGLQHVSNLRELKLIAMPREFNDRVRNEDRYKVQHIPSIIFEKEL